MRLLLERQAWKTKEKQPAAIAGPKDTLAVNTGGPKTVWCTPCTNFFTSATVAFGRKRFRIEKVMIDAGSVVNVASIRVLESMVVALFLAHDLIIRTATSGLT
jgi:hypothetical protein